MDIKVENIKGITLLSKEEALKFPQNILDSVYQWWLRDKYAEEGYYSSTSTIYYACSSWKPHENLYPKPSNDINGIRPALIIDSSLGLKNGDIIKIFNKKWYYQDGLALLMGVLKKFSKFSEKKAPTYEDSDVKKYIEKWLEKKTWETQAKEILGRTDLTIDEATNIFIHQVVLSNGIPFEIKK